MLPKNMHEAMRVGIHTIHYNTIQHDDCADHHSSCCCEGFADTASRILCVSWVHFIGHLSSCSRTCHVSGRDLAVKALILRMSGTVSYQVDASGDEICDVVCGSCVSLSLVE